MKKGFYLSLEKVINKLPYTKLMIFYYCKRFRLVYFRFRLKHQAWRACNKQNCRHSFPTPLFKTGKHFAFHFLFTDFCQGILYFSCNFSEERVEIIRSVVLL